MVHIPELKLSPRNSVVLNSVSGGASLEDVGKLTDSVRSSPTSPPAENFEFGYAVKDDVKGDDFSHLVSLILMRMIFDDE